MNSTTRSYVPTFLRLLGFLSAPLLLELLVYLRRPDILPPASELGSVLLVLVYAGLLFAAMAAVGALMLSKTAVRIEVVFPCIFLGLFLALIASRLLPFDSGFSLKRILVFGLSALISGAFYIFLSRRDLPWPRLMAAQWIFCSFAASQLGVLYDFPLHSPVTAFILLPLLFAIVCLLPSKFIAAIGVLFLVLQYPSRTVVPSFAPPLKLAPYRRVIIVGIDGLSPEVVRKMASAGQLPAFQRLIDQGVFGKFHTLSIPFSPLVWNSIYTGAQPKRHGIMAFTQTGVSGAKPFLSLWLDEWTNSDWIHLSVELLKKTRLIRVVAPATALDRKAPAIWNIMDQNGAASIVLGGWTTYPPEIIRGQFVSDYATTAARPLGTYYPVSKQLESLLSYAPEVSSGPKEIQRYLAKDAKIHHLAQALIPQASPETRLVFSYYCAVDAYGHHYGTYLDMKSTPPAQRAKLLKIREDVYKTVDRYVGDYLAMVDDQTLLIVCSDHGFHFDKRQHNYPVDGVLMMLGRGVRKNITIEDDVLSLAPTVTYALGLPPSVLFQGSPIKQAFEGMIHEEPAKSYTPASRFFKLSGKEELDEQKLQELEDLQYINR